MSATICRDGGPSVPLVQRRPDFSAAESWENGEAAGSFGPGSNTGPKGGTGLRGSLSAPLIDWITIVVKPGAQEKAGVYDWRDFLAWLFGWRDQVLLGSIEKRQWQFYEESASLVDRTSSSCGKVGWKTEGDRAGSLCISISGNGCRWIPQDLASRKALVERLHQVDAKLTRLDIAVDDLSGETINLLELDREARAGKDGGFCSRGRPPRTQLIDDHDSGQGKTLYIGQKGHKQLCIYEKGKQLGDPSSNYTRCELRLYGSKLELPLEAILDLEGYYAGAYPLLADFILGEATRLIVKEHQADCTVEAFARVARQQMGTALGLVWRALGEHNAIEFVRAELLRPGTPGRFQGHTQQELDELFRQAIAKRRNDDEQAEPSDDR